MFEGSAQYSPVSPAEDLERLERVLDLHMTPQVPRARAVEERKDQSSSSSNARNLAEVELDPPPINPGTASERQQFQGVHQQADARTDKAELKLQRSTATKAGIPPPNRKRPSPLPSKAHRNPTPPQGGPKSGRRSPRNMPGAPASQDGAFDTALEANEAGELFASRSFGDRSFSSSHCAEVNESIVDAVGPGKGVERMTHPTPPTAHSFVKFLETHLFTPSSPRAQHVAQYCVRVARG